MKVKKMNFESNCPPSQKITKENYINKIEDCNNFVNDGNWNEFAFLLKLLLVFFEENSDINSDAIIMLEKIKTKSIEEILKNLEMSTVYEEFRSLLTVLSEIVDDRRQLWNIIHTQMHPTIKVNVHQAHEIAVAYFSPSNLFDFGIKPFIQASENEFNNIPNEEALIDIFYHLVGFEKACGVDSNFKTSNPDYIDLIKRIFNNFILLNDFDAHRFVWLVETVHLNMHLPNAVLNEICQEIIIKIRKIQMETILKLHKLCILSTSPFMHDIPLLNEEIDNNYNILLEENRVFLEKYIFSCFATINLTGDKVALNVSIPTKCWILYIDNFSYRLEERPELSTLILADIIKYSLIFFGSFYGDLQATKQKAIGLRADILKIIECIIAHYPGNMNEEMIKRIWYLLLIVAFSGATDEEIENIKNLEPSKPGTPFLGLEHTETGFNNYNIALGYLSTVFADERDNFPKMAKYIREKFV